MATQKKRRGRNTKARRRGAGRRPKPSRREARPTIQTSATPGVAASHEVLIVGVGASAGGLEAFSQLLGALPEQPGLAVVLVQHLAPQHTSALPALLSGRTPMAVVQAQEGMRVEPNHVYVIPPNVQMGIHDDVLHLMPRPTDRTQYTPIDFFMRSLADSAQERAVAVILSGTASDGTHGVRDVKAVGGITIAQTPETAKYDGMPRAAIATGLVDLVLAPHEIAAELVRIARHPLRRARSVAGDDVVAGEAFATGPHLENIFNILRAATGVDFRCYKPPTIQRRLQRRMVLYKLTRVDQYVRYLRENPQEVQALYDDILIHVTRFFREPESFSTLKTEVLPQLLQDRPDDQPLRVWVPGCSTGEEAYSLAIVLLEVLGERAGVIPIQVFATDIADAAIEHARAGVYPASVAGDISKDRLRHFFSKSDGGYRVIKAVRDLCVFARQDLIRDPPFSKLDIIVCRNVLIYMGSELQKKLMNVFHYALRPTGVLMLGNAESIGFHSDLFTTAGKKHHIYQKRLVPSPTVQSAIDHGVPAPPPLPTRPHAGGEAARSIQNEANRLIQERYAPSGVIVDTDLHIVQFRGHTGNFLEAAPGDPSLSILKMAREGLLHALRSVFQEMRRTKAPARREGVRFRANGGWRTMTLSAIPLVVSDPPHFLLLFEPTAVAADVRGGKPAPRRREGRQDKRTDDRMESLQRELASSREYLQSIIQELEAANEELQSANEEVLSANEELQSTNEELDTAKEELQSTNEELNTVNDELHGRNEELSRVNSDLTNLLGSVQIAIVIVETDLRIRRFTPMAERVLNLIPTDVGRPISHIKPNIDCPDLEELIMQVIDTVTPAERDVQDRQGNSFSLRIRPYKNLENRIDGAVLALFDVQRSRDQDLAVHGARDFAESVVQTVRQPIAVLDGALRVTTVNRAFCDTFGLTPAQAEGQPLFELNAGQWNIPRLRELLTEDGRRDLSGEGVEVEHKTMHIQVRRLVAGGDDHEDDRILLVIENATREHPSGASHQA